MGAARFLSKQALHLPVQSPVEAEKPSLLHRQSAAMPAVRQLAHVIAFGSAFVFLAQATSQTGCAAGGNYCELTLLQLRATKNQTKPETQAETASAGQCTREDEAEMEKFGGGSRDGSF